MKTLRREPEMSDAQWLALIDEVIEVGVVEAVLTGGEPLLRKKLTIEAATRLSHAGVAVILNTNGWFVDDSTAATLAALPNVRVSVSIDGVTPELHDTARGVPGSWIRAIEATNRLLSYGADVRVNHVVTPTNQHEVEAFVDAMVAFGVSSLRVTGAGLDVGATSRDGDWRLNNEDLARTMSTLMSRYRGRLAMRYLPQSATTGFERAPQAFLVRPDGSFVLDSRRPLRFGSTPVKVNEAWNEVRQFWATEGSSGVNGRLSGHIAYREADVVAGAVPSTTMPMSIGTPVTIDKRPSERASREIPLGVPVLTDSGNVISGRATIEALADARRYETATLRWAGDRDGERSIRTATGSKHTVDRRAGAILDAFARGECLADGLRAASRACGDSPEALRSIAHDLIRRSLLVADGTSVAYWRSA